jgi:hypothetical protein
MYQKLFTHSRSFEGCCCHFSKCCPSFTKVGACFHPSTSEFTVAGSCLQDFATELAKLAAFTLCPLRIVLGGLLTWESLYLHSTELVGSFVQLAGHCLGS